MRSEDDIVLARPARGGRRGLRGSLFVCARDAERGRKVLVEMGFSADAQRRWCIAKISLLRLEPKVPAARAPRWSRRRVLRLW
jgi:hypothetical protein